MKFLILVAAFLVSFAVANDTQLGRIEPVGEPTQGTDGFLFEHPFDYGILTNGLAVSAGNMWAMADDFIAPEDYQLELIDLWMIYTDGNTDVLDFEIRSDTGGSGPDANLLWEAAIADLTHEDTGYTNWGYVLWHTIAPLSEEQYFRADGEVCYWLVIQSHGMGTDYWLCSDQCMGNNMSYFSQDDGLSWTSSYDQWGMAYDQFMLLDGTAQGALDSETWGTIKAIF